jgi:hypothetical protein
MRTSNHTGRGELVEMTEPPRTRAGLNHIGAYLDRETVEKCYSAEAAWSRQFEAHQTGATSPAGQARAAADARGGRDG